MSVWQPGTVRLKAAATIPVRPVVVSKSPARNCESAQHQPVESQAGVPPELNEVPPMLLWNTSLVRQLPISSKTPMSLPAAASKDPITSLRLATLPDRGVLSQSTGLSKPIAAVVLALKTLS